MDSRTLTREERGVVGPIVEGCRSQAHRLPLCELFRRNRDLPCYDRENHERTSAWVTQPGKVGPRSEPRKAAPSNRRSIASPIRGRWSSWPGRNHVVQTPRATGSLKVTAAADNR